MKRKKSTLIYGRGGIRKTWILRKLEEENGICVEYPGMKFMLESIVKSKSIFSKTTFKRYINPFG